MLQAGLRPRVAPSHLVALGASAGGIPALIAVLGALPTDLHAAVVVVLHLDPEHESHLAAILARGCRLPVKRAEDGAPLETGTVYVAPPDVHLVVLGDRVALTHTAPVHFSRPSVDALLQSVARAYGRRAVGVILSGTGSDGADGIMAIKRAGGMTVAQDPGQADHPGMPRAACQTGCVDWALPLAEIGAFIADAVGVSAA